MPSHHQAKQGAATHGAMPLQAPLPARPRFGSTTPQVEHPLKPLRLILLLSTAPQHHSPYVHHPQRGDSMHHLHSFAINLGHIGPGNGRQSFSTPRKRPESRPPPPSPPAAAGCRSGDGPDCRKASGPRAARAWYPARQKKPRRVSAFHAMGAGRLELPQSCDLRILSPLRLPIPPCPRVTAMAPFRSDSANTLGPHQAGSSRSQAKSWIAPRPLRRRKRGWSWSSRLHHHLPSVKLAGPALLVRGNCRLMPCHCSTT